MRTSLRMIRRLMRTDEEEGRGRENNRKIADARKGELRKRCSAVTRNSRFEEKTPVFKGRSQVSQNLLLTAQLKYKQNEGGSAK